jgi:hypothetical protein
MCHQELVSIRLPDWCGQGQVGQRVLATLLEQQAHQYTRVLSCTAVSVVFPSTSEGKTYPGENRQHHSGGLHQPSGWPEVPPHPSYGTGAPSLGSGTPSVSTHSTHTWHPECGSGYALKRGPAALGLEPISPGHAAPVGQVWLGAGGPVCLPWQCTLPPVVLHVRSTRASGLGCSGS